MKKWIQIYHDCSKYLTVEHTETAEAEWGNKSDGEVNNWEYFIKSSWGRNTRKVCSLQSFQLQFQKSKNAFLSLRWEFEELQGCLHDRAENSFSSCQFPLLKWKVSSEHLSQIQTTQMPGDHQDRENAYWGFLAVGDMVFVLIMQLQ